MNKENLKRGQELSGNIERLERQLNVLNKATNLSSSTIGFYESGTGNVGEISASWIDFDVLKCLAINKITKRLEEIKKEFEAL